MDDIYKNVLKEIKPKKNENELILKKAKNFIKKYLNNFKTSFGGSIIKNTNIKQKKEIDIYYIIKELKSIKKIKKAIKETKPRTLKGSRDIFQINYEGLVIELVPVLEIKKNEIINSIDASIYHASYVKENLKNPDQVRILKQFLKANNLYGAESYLNGLSGYACELLIIKFNDFISTIKKFKNIKLNQNLSIIKTKNIKNFDSITIKDPTLLSRNVGASLSKKNFDKFKKLCQNFVKNPNINFFNEDLIEEKLDEDKFFFKIKTGYKNEIKLSKLHKRIKKLKTQLELKGVKIKNYGIFFKNFENYAYLSTNFEKIPKKKVLKGPPINMEKNVKEFKKKHKRIFIKEKKLYSIIIQEELKIIDLLKNIL